MTRLNYVAVSLSSPGNHVDMGHTQAFSRGLPSTLRPSGSMTLEETTVRAPLAKNCCKRRYAVSHCIWKSGFGSHTPIILFSCWPLTSWSPSQLWDALSSLLLSPNGRRDELAGS